MAFACRRLAVLPPLTVCLALFLGLPLTMLTTQVADAQTFTVLHQFDGPDGSSPEAGLTMDQAGNLYGTASQGGYTGGDCYNGCGTVFKLERKNSGWVFSVLYTFTGPDGALPMSRVIIGPDGSLYGTTNGGGPFKHGTVFRLQPPPAFCRAIRCPWTETILYSFKGGTDGEGPYYGDLIFDQAGNIYGTTVYGGGTTACLYGCGVVFELTPSNGSWTESVLYRFQGSPDGQWPFAGAIFDAQGNLYGTTFFGGTDDYGTVYELAHSQSGWTETVLHNFSFSGTDGNEPYGGLISDQAGNLYGLTSLGGVNQGGTAFELTPSNGGWNVNVLYSLDAYQGSAGGLTFGPDGKLYGSLLIGNVEVFQLTQSDGTWAQTGIDGSAGAYPFGNVIFDAAGHLYATAFDGQSNSDGIVFEVTP